MEQKEDADEVEMIEDKARIAAQLYYYCTNEDGPSQSSYNELAKQYGVSKSAIQR